MQIRHDGLAAALRKPLPPLVWVHGDEPLLVIEATDAVRSTLRAAGFDQRDVFTVDRSFSVDALFAQTQSMSLFATSRIIELRLNGKPGKELGDALARAASSVDDSIRLLVSGPRLDKPTQSTAWFTALDRHAMGVAIYPVERARLADWISQRLARQNQQADADTLQFLAERVEGNLLAAHQEIRKLALLFPKGALPADGVRQAVLNVARYDAWGLADAMLAGDVARTMRSVDGLRSEGEAGPLVLWAIAEAIRNIGRLLDARDSGRAPASMMRDLRIYPPRDQFYLLALERVDRASVEAALRSAAGIDRIVKGLRRGDAWSAMMSLATSIAGAAGQSQFSAAALTGN